MADAAANTRRWFEEIWNRGNLDVIDEYMAPGTVIHDAGPEPGDISEPDVFKGMASALRSAFPDIHVEVHDAILEGEKTAVRFTARGTHKGTFLGFAPTGREFTISGMGWGEWRGDKLVRAWNNIDLLSLLTQIGAVKRP
jgi:predicted ester cyclase